MSSSFLRVLRAVTLRAALGSVSALLLPGGFCPSAFSAGIVPNSAEVRFATSRTVLWLGHTQIIPLHLKTPPEEDASYNASVNDPRVVEILRGPVFLVGEQTAYVRVRALQAGQTRLEIHGGPALDIDVKPDPAEPANASIDQESHRPQIVSPMPGAVVWGEFGVGVTVFDEPPATPFDGEPPLPGTAATAPAPPANAAAASVKVQLRLPDGRLLDPVGGTPPTFGPERQYQFNVQASDLPAGPAQLVAVATGDGPGDFQRRIAGHGLESLPLTVHVQAPQPTDLWSGECESPTVLGTTKDLYAPARPARFGIEQPNVGKDPNASGLEFVQGVNRGWCLPFIVKTAGEYQMIVRARAEFAGAAYPTAAIYINDAEVPAGLVRLVGSKYHRVPIGTPIHLDVGPQILCVQFKNTFGQARENRNLFLDSYEIARVDDSAGKAARPGGPLQAGAPAPSPAGGLHTAAPIARPSIESTNGSTALAPAPPLTAATAPQLSILYPANGAGVFGADAVVARASGGTARVDQADLLIDGWLQHVAVRNPEGNDPMVFPLLLRGLEPGEHRLAVRAKLASGQTFDSAANFLVVLPEAPENRGPYERAVWLLDRVGFGPEPKALAAILTQGESKWLATQLLAPSGNAAEEKVLETACKNYPHADNPEQTVYRVLFQWMETDNPVRARFTEWAENHFSTWMTKAKPAPKWQEHQAFAKLGIAPFGDLLEASAHSSAMLAYLDQEKSYAGKINENYAREIMELHTLGVHGGYKQTDVTELAEVLNGWTTAGEASLPDPNPALRLVSDTHDGEAGLSHYFRFVPALNDGKPRRVLGMEFGAADPVGRFDRIQLALEMLAAHPSTAEHICRKLAEQYVGVPAPDPLVHRLAAVFMESGGDMRVVLFTMVGDPAFWKAPPKVATPLDYGMRASRLCRAAARQAGQPHEPLLKPEVVETFLKRSGMGLFDRVTPDGYPENSDAYADSNALLQRWRFMQSQTQALDFLVPAAWRTPPGLVDEDDLNHVDAPEVDPAQRFVDLAAVRLTGRLLSTNSNKAALEVIGQGRPQDLEQTLVFVSLLPETSLR